MRRLEQNFLGMVTALSIAGIEKKEEGRCFRLRRRLRSMILRCIGKRLSNYAVQRLLALLGISQRQINVKRPLDSGIKRNRKPFPSEPKTPGQKLRKSRIERGLTQRELAVVLKVPREHISNWELDKTSPSAEFWSKIFQVD